MAAETSASVADRCQQTLGLAVPHPFASQVGAQRVASYGETLAVVLGPKGKQIRIYDDEDDTQEELDISTANVRPRSWRLFLPAVVFE